MGRQHGRVVVCRSGRGRTHGGGGSGGTTGAVVSCESSRGGWLWTLGGLGGCAGLWWRVVRKIDHLYAPEKKRRTEARAENAIFVSRRVAGSKGTRARRRHLRRYVSTYLCGVSVDSVGWAACL